MTPNLFILILALACYLALAWGFRTLPRENWQILAAMPRRKDASGSWQGINMTWYGFLTANAYLAATAILFLLLGTLRVPLPAALTVAMLMLGICVPASRLVAWIVEGKAHTFTVGGAVFVGTLCAPWVVGMVNILPWQKGSAAMPVLATLAAIVTAYAFGEGLGRLACLSFGCCYGKPIEECSPLVRRFLSRYALVFSGNLKKIAYASGLQGRPVVPVQALTAVLYVTTGLVNTKLFLSGHFAAAFVLGTLVTQGWRVGSELMRADYRGDLSFSAYQWMGLAAIPYSLAMAWWFAGGAPGLPELAAGFSTLWHPAVLLALQGLWLSIFLYTGRSAVTGSTLSFHVHEDRI
ncbi:MAG: prolipoprotein diacylglyceryl transferase family protein [Geoalkalibacter sp.]|uniref:prolipoprotein diacylglyceryl transferase family protein n=1 Tax=Geoalkalibacter sp. TaxID=3041440 RepID=UPI003D147802